MVETEVRTMASTRQLDIEVAEKVFGKRVVFIKALQGYKWDDETPIISEYPAMEEHGTTAYEDLGNVVINLVPCYSTEFEAATEVVRHMVENGWKFVLKKHGEGRYVASFEWASAGGDTIPLAICRAALMAIGEIR